ncbi:hypothetical protein CC2G_004064 [Coprinopsis cinerea AmutBmut pab1-1]|nr:hypothetical protein CC2G_004064 [Coprinopsis cinerea AmutBmut pab1-1]
MLSVAFVHLSLLLALANGVVCYRSGQATNWRNITIDDHNPSIFYSGPWKRTRVYDELYYGGAVTFSSSSFDSKASASFTFNGTAYYFISPRFPLPITISLSLDEGTPITVNLQDPYFARTTHSFDSHIPRRLGGGHTPAHGPPVSYYGSGGDNDSDPTSPPEKDEVIRPSVPGGDDRDTRLRSPTVPSHIVAFQHGLDPTVEHTLRVFSPLDGLVVLDAIMYTTADHDPGDDPSTPPSSSPDSPDGQCHTQTIAEEWLSIAKTLATILASTSAGFYLRTKVDIRIDMDHYKIYFWRKNVEDSESTGSESTSSQSRGSQSTSSQSPPQTNDELAGSPFRVLGGLPDSANNHPPSSQAGTLQGTPLSQPVPLVPESPSVHVLRLSQPHRNLEGLGDDIPAPEPFGNHGPNEESGATALLVLTP